MKNLILLAALFFASLAQAETTCGKVTKVVLQRPQSVTVNATTIVARIAEDNTSVLLTNAMANNLNVCIHTLIGNYGDQVWIAIDSIEK